MRPRLVACRRTALTATARLPRPLSLRRGLVSVNSAQGRPVLPFLVIPRASPSVARSFTSERRKWLKHEAKLVVRYTLALWGIIAACVVISLAVSEEMTEREFPTPHEWRFWTRKLLRAAYLNRAGKDGDIDWSSALDLARCTLYKLEDSSCDGSDLVKLSEGEMPVSDQNSPPSSIIAGEFFCYNISARSEEWRRGYFDTLLLAAEAAEHVGDWVCDRTRRIGCPPEYVIGPSNPHPKPLPPGNPPAPREEDCDPAYPSAENWYKKILATEGLTSNQIVQAALRYASFIEFKGRPDDAEALYGLALAEASRGAASSTLPYDPRSLVLNEDAEPASTSVLDALTAIANFKARKGDVSSALPMYISLLKTRRSLPDMPPVDASPALDNRSRLQRLIDFVSPPPYPAPPSDGSRPPWRSHHERCVEASLHLYIGEILYARSTHADGLAWTRDGVDMAEEQLRAVSKADKEAAKTCRECLATGLDNWATMVRRLAKAEEDKAASKSKLFSLWSGPKEIEGRWAAEVAVVEEHVRRTSELMEDLTPSDTGILSYFKA